MWPRRLRGAAAGVPAPPDYDNAQATANYSHEAVKRTKDLTSSLMTTYYGQGARRNHHIGGSKGGQEGLQSAQRYAADFDGVVSVYPGAQNQALRLGWNRLRHFVFNPSGGSLDTAKQQLLKTAVMTACDGLDGAMDGIVSNTLACERSFRVDRLRCSGPTNVADACFTDRQILALKIAARPFDFAHPMPHGLSSVGPWPVPIGSDLQLWIGTGADRSQQGFYRANGAFNRSWDSLAALDAWVESGAAPTTPIAVDTNAGSSGRQRPLCEYPAWPKYRGSGDVNRGENFECATH